MQHLSPTRPETGQDAPAVDTRTLAEEWRNIGERLAQAWLRGLSWREIEADSGIAKSTAHRRAQPFLTGKTRSKKRPRNSDATAARGLSQPLNTQEQP